MCYFHMGPEVGGYPKSYCLYVGYVLLAGLPQWKRKHLALQRLEVPGWGEIPRGASPTPRRRGGELGKGLCEEGDWEGISE